MITQKEFNTLIDEVYRNPLRIFRVVVSSWGLNIKYDDFEDVLFGEVSFQLLKKRRKFRDKTHFRNSFWITLKGRVINTLVRNERKEKKEILVSADDKVFVSNSDCKFTHPITTFEYMKYGSDVVSLAAAATLKNLSKNGGSGRIVKEGFGDTTCVSGKIAPYYTGDIKLGVLHVLYSTCFKHEYFTLNEKVEKQCKEYYRCDSLHFSKSSIKGDAKKRARKLYREEFLRNLECYSKDQSLDLDSSFFEIEFHSDKDVVRKYANHHYILTEKDITYNCCPTQLDYNYVPHIIESKDKEQERWKPEERCATLFLGLVKIEHRTLGDSNHKECLVHELGTFEVLPEIGRLGSKYNYKLVPFVRYETLGNS